MSFGFLRNNDPVKPEDTMPLREYLAQWSQNDELSLNPAGRLRNAIKQTGEEEIDYRKEPRFARIFSGRPMRRYKAFERLVGCEAPIQKFVRFLENARDGLQAERQIVSFVGPVATGKSTIAAICKDLFETQPAWVLGYTTDKGAIMRSPVFENPLGLFNRKDHGKMLEREYRIPDARLITSASGWATERFIECGGDLSRFVAVRVMPSKAKGILLAKADPDTVGLYRFVGSADRSGNSEEYQYSGLLNRTTTGLLEFAEMWNADWMSLQPFLSVTQELEYVADGALGMLPYQGLIIAHGNERPWLNFRAGKFSRSGSQFTEGLVDRIVTIEVPYCIRISELAQRYGRSLVESGLRDLHIAPGALEVLAAFPSAARLKDPVNCSQRIDIHDGRHVGEKADTAEDLREKSHWRDGMSGPTERVMLGVLPELAAADPEEPGLDPVLVLQELRKYVVRERLPDYGEPETDGKMTAPQTIVNEVVAERCQRLVLKAIQEAYFESWPTHVADQIERYVDIAAAWCEKTDFKPDQGEIIRYTELDDELRRIDLGVKHEGNVKDFRNDMAMSAVRHRSKPENAGIPVWKTLPEHLRRSFEKNLRPKKKDMLELIDPSLERKKPEKIKKHEEFLARLCAQGYTMRQTLRIVKWFVEYGK